MAPSFGTHESEAATKPADENDLLHCASEEISTRHKEHARACAEHGSASGEREKIPLHTYRI